MKYIKFEIENYKGVKKLELDLSIEPDHKIYTLIGLNESGKTTILEAINDFEYDVPVSLRHMLIPKNAAGGFTGDVIIKAHLELSDDDKKNISTFIKSKKTFKEIVLLDKFTLERKYTFNNSTPTGSSRKYSHFIQVRKTEKSKHTSMDDQLNEEVWLYIKAKLFPEIIFYRDFLSTFPEKIYLQPDPNKVKEREYFSIIEDVLTSVSPSYNIQTSLLDRLITPTDANRQAREAVENEMAAKISSTVFDAWNKIQKVSKKEIVVKAEQDPNDERFYLKLNVKEGHQTFAISERSLGFRWFFTFLLYTEFRKERIKTSGEILFLLDEPASNLHPAAQQSLLDTFKTITTKSRLVYTTHSHHLINPAWLNTAYIIKNNGLEYKEDDGFNSKKTEVEAFKYKQFVSIYPTETTYFQPILEVLDYKPGLLEYVPNIVITEGKFDYFTFRFFKEIIFENKSNNYTFYPGHGATKLDLPIGLYESWGKQYIVILDSDKEGVAQKKRYIKELSDKEHVFSLEDIDSIFKNMKTEDLFTSTEKVLISQEYNKNLTSYEKSAFNTGLQILFGQNIKPEYISEETKTSFRKIIDFIEDQFQPSA